MKRARAAEDAAVRADRFVLRLRQFEFRLQDLEARRTAGFEALAGRIARAGDDGLQVVEQGDARIGDRPIEIRPPHRVSRGRDELGNLRFGRLGFRLGDVDAPAALAAKLERQRKRIGLVREVAVVFDAAFRD